MERLTKEELLQDIADGNRTIKELATIHGLSANSMKHALANLGINLKEMRSEPEPVIIDNLAASDEDAWHQLYKEYDLEGAIGNQAQFMIAQCRVIDGMTVAQARQYMKDNFHYQTMIIKFSK